MKKTLLIIGLLTIFMMVTTVVWSVQAAGFSVDVSQAGWENVGIKNDYVGNATFDGIDTVSGSGSYNFDFQYKQWVEGGHWDYALPVIVVPGTDAHCPEGFATNVDPAHPDLCAAPNPLTYHQECDQGCPTVVFSDSRVVVDQEAQWVCPSDPGAYTSSSFWLPCKMKVNGHWRYADKILIPAVTHVENYGPINIPYSKSGDQTKCHRPSDSQLRALFPGIPSWVRHDITSNKLNDGENPGITPEWLNMIDVNCHPVSDPQTYSYEEMISDVPPIYGCPTDYEKDPENAEQCRVWVDESANIYMTLNFKGTVGDSPAVPKCVRGNCGAPRQEVTPLGGVGLQRVTWSCIDTPSGCMSDSGIVVTSYVPVYYTSLTGACIELESHTNLDGRQVWLQAFEFKQPWMGAGFESIVTLVNPSVSFRADLDCSVPLANKYVVKDWGWSCSVWPEFDLFVKTEDGINYLWRGPLVNTSDMQLMLTSAFPGTDFTSFLSGVGNKIGWLALP